MGRQGMEGVLEGKDLLIREWKKREKSAKNKRPSSMDADQSLDGVDALRLHPSLYPPPHHDITNTHNQTYKQQVAVMRKDYDGLKARYYNDTQETAMVGRSNVFVEIMSVVDDFERAKVRKHKEMIVQGWVGVVRGTEAFRDPKRIGHAKLGGRAWACACCLLYRRIWCRVLDSIWMWTVTPES